MKHFARTIALTLAETLLTGQLMRVNDRKKKAAQVQQNRMAVQACLGCKTPGAQACRLRLTVRCKNSSFSTALDRAHLAALGPATNVFEKPLFLNSPQLYNLMLMWKCRHNLLIMDVDL